MGCEYIQNIRHSSDTVSTRKGHYYSGTWLCHPYSELLLTLQVVTDRPNAHLIPIQKNPTY